MEKRIQDKSNIMLTLDEILTEVPKNKNILSLKVDMIFHDYDSPYVYGGKGTTQLFVDSYSKILEIADKQCKNGIIQNPIRTPDMFIKGAKYIAFLVEIIPFSYKGNTHDEIGTREYYYIDLRNIISDIRNRKLDKLI